MDELTKKYNLIIYTALIGLYDDLIEIDYYLLPKDTLLLCFTDNIQLTSNNWTIQYLDCEQEESAIINRKIKILFMDYLPNHEYSLYIDSNIRIKKPILNLFTNLVELKFELIVPKHHRRDCIYEESKPILLLGKEKENIVNSQLNRYRSEGFPKNFGLGENNIIFRNNSSIKLKKLMKQWWEEYESGAKRDQLSLMYCIWKSNFVNYKLGILSSRRNEFFGLELHKNEKKIYLVRSGYAFLKKLHDNYQPLPNFYSLILVYYRNFLEKIFNK